MKIAALSMLVGIHHSSIAQRDASDKVHSVIVMDFKLPSPTGNPSFRRVMNGLISVDLNYQYHVKGDWAFGGGMEYSYFDVNGNVFQSNVVGRIETMNPFVKVAKRIDISDRMFAEYALLSGYNLALSTSNQCTDTYKQSGFNIQPKIGVYVKQGDALSFGLVASYNYLNYNFSPDNLCLDYFPGIGPDLSLGNTHYFSIGFGFSTYILPPSKD